MSTISSLTFFYVRVVKLLLRPSVQNAGSMPTRADRAEDKEPCPRAQAASDWYATWEWATR